MYEVTNQMVQGQKEDRKTGEVKIQMRRLEKDARFEKTARLKKQKRDALKVLTLM